MSEQSSNLSLQRAETVVARPLPRTPNFAPDPEEPHQSAFSRTDILYALFKHKKKIAFLTVVGLVAAAAVFFLWRPVYRSDAKLLVRYVVERSGVDSIDDTRASSTINPTSILGSELSILMSWDLAVEVAEALGPKRILPNEETPTKEAAASRIMTGLGASILEGSNIIHAQYESSDPQVATLVLDELVARYFNKHLEVHRSIGAFDFVSQQTDQLRSRLSQTEDALKEIKEKAGILSLPEAIGALNGDITRTQTEINQADADIAEQDARVRQLEGAVVEINPDNNSPEASPTASPSAEVPENIVEQYQEIVSRIPALRQDRRELMSKYTAENELVKQNQADIRRAEAQRRELEKEYPVLPALVKPIVTGTDVDPAGEMARLAGLKAKRTSLVTRLAALQVEQKKLFQLGPQIADLERQKLLEETNYKYFQNTLEKARVDEALDPTKIPNITAVQRPSPPIIVTGKRDKTALLLAASGLALGVAFALLKELILTRTLRRPAEVEKHVGVTPLMTIPYAPRFEKSPATKNGSYELVPVRSGPRDLAPWEADHFVRPYTEAIRDRLGLFFELHNLTHKPKLVGVAGVVGGSGASTLAAGLAAALSETNDGKVLLVDASLGPDHVHPFFKGKPAYPLNAALKANGSIDPAAENLYLAQVGSPNAGPAQLGLKKFFDLMPNLKASDFDYIIFDLPPLEQTSPTWGMAPFMDKMLVVLESEKNDRDLVARNYRRLTQERENVSVILNKVRSYAPKSLHLDS